eukprot:CAMPEP_0183742128 /NCGR_PEP_ID=MMETSP0737-20130205/63991_1 /TAXON_ID=385413 /ORGANISM="Thalassiosira miniscula, Strain CCMP1093" /LENGTH=832 /DNA_ID=CAMNT_0025977657 /DNA_START=9 /DNA_END=2507 /DNA_ORIENTATION=+
MTEVSTSLWKMKYNPSISSAPSMQPTVHPSNMPSTGGEIPMHSSKGQQGSSMGHMPTEMLTMQQGNNSPSVAPLPPTSQPSTSPLLATICSENGEPSSSTNPSLGHELLIQPPPTFFTYPTCSPSLGRNGKKKVEIPSVEPTIDGQPIGSRFFSPTRQPAETVQSSYQKFMPSSDQSFVMPTGSTSLPNTGPIMNVVKPSWTWGESSPLTGNILSTHASCCTMPTSSCFVSTFPRWKTKHVPNLLSGGMAGTQIRPAAIPRNGVGCSGSWLRSFHLTAAGRGNDELDPSLGNGDQPQKQLPPPSSKIPPLLMYTAVPFLPSILLTTLNDEYQSMKSQFNTASAALPANILKDSAEYLSVSTMYNETMSKLLVLLLTKRLALYFLATLATTYAGWRASLIIASMSSGIVSGPGNALDRLNGEILEGKDYYVLTMDDDDEKKKDSMNDDDDDDDLFATLLDDNPESSNVGNALALALPLILFASLGVSYLAIVFSESLGGDQSQSSSGLGLLPDTLTSSLPYLTSLPSALLCLVFLATEFRWALPDSGGNAKALESESTIDSSSLLCAGNILALMYVTGAYFAKVHPTLSLNEMKLDLWPLQNGVNIALATTVTRALSPFLLRTPSPSSVTQSSYSGNKSIRTVALALIGLTLFDAISTFGTVANAAVDATESSMSVMETVARAKLASPSSQNTPLAFLWQPGLLEIILGHDSSKVTEALGLGDIVFPSLLVAWGFAADHVDALSRSDEDDAEKVDPSPSKLSSHPYATATIIGYIFGSFATEIVGSFRLLGNISGLPALVFLVPSMLAAVSMTAWSRNEVADVWDSTGEDDGV